MLNNVVPTVLEYSKYEKPWLWKVIIIFCTLIQFTEEKSWDKGLFHYRTLARLTEKVAESYIL